MRMFTLKLEDGKYEYRRDGGTQVVLRYGAPWRDLTGDKFVYLLTALIEEQAAEIATKDAAIMDALPGTWYMDPPDGGGVTLEEQLQRMAKDAARYRLLRSSHPIHDNSPFVCRNFGATFSQWTGEHADAAIDAAMVELARIDAKGPQT